MFWSSFHYREFRSHAVCIEVVPSLVPRFVGDRVRPGVAFVLGRALHLGHAAQHPSHSPPLVLFLSSRQLSPANYTYLVILFSSVMSSPCAFFAQLVLRYHSMYAPFSRLSSVITLCMHLIPDISSITAPCTRLVPGLSSGFPFFLRCRSLPILVSRPQSS